MLLTGGSVEGAPGHAANGIPMPTADPGKTAQGWLEGRQQKKGLRPRYAAYVIIVLWFAAVLVWGVFEHLVDDQTFPTVWLGMWWALQTVTTVGYGDVVPQNDIGRAFASLLMLGGLAFLSVVTATITSSFVARRQAELAETFDDPVMERVGALHDRLDGIEAQLRRITERDA
jgi:hypothetical protein